ncbi:MAG: branched-chain amino acid ABC transporter permease, partial [Actinomycetota bacterium]|nr:branched-chain amino acid ABC transporter permease [Actinomycetota bacterium]
AETAAAVRAAAPRPDRFRPAAAGWIGRGVVWAALAWVVLCLPGNIASPVSLSATEARGASEAVVFAIIGLSLNVLIGYAGQISLGHQAFVGIGAFTSAFVVTELGQEFWLGVIVAALVGALQALLLGGVALRVTGLYFALITLSYGVMVQQSLFNVESLTGGVAGRDAPLPTGVSSAYGYYYVCLGLLALVLWLDWRLTRTKAGRALLAVRENPRVAATLGIDIRGYTVLAFMVSGFFAGIGGALFAHRDGFVVAEPFTFQLALIFIIMTVVGGLRSRSGVVLGSAFFALMGDGILLKLLRLEGFFENVVKLPSEFVPLVLGPLLLLLTLTLYPGGIGQQVAPVRGWLLGGRFDRHAGAVKEVQVTDVRA